MVFGFFGKSKGTAPETKEVEPARVPTPSPSESASAASEPPRSPEPVDAHVKGVVKRSRSLSPAGAGVEVHLPPSNSGELLALIKKVPPKTLHSYVVQHVPDASPQEILELTEFFATLVPPPKLHCVRCHKGFVEVENMDRSCLVPHDDESAEVEYVGNSKSKVAGVVGTTYETLWGCCNRLVEGDGDQGPPDGWCYEGFHTTDIKRARFRADSTPQNDKLISCARLRCFGRSDDPEGRGRSQRAAARKNLKEASDEEEDYDMRELEREADALGGESDSNGKKKKDKMGAKGRKRKSDVLGDTNEKEKGETESCSVAGSSNAKDDKPAAPPKPRTKSMKSKSTAKPKPAATSAISHPSPLPDGDAEMANPAVPEVDGEVKSSTAPKPKKPRKPRKSVTAGDGGKYVPPKDDAYSSDSLDEEDERPRRKKRKST